MPHLTINRQGAIDLFSQLLQPDSQWRILRLTGEAKMGKSHLMTKVFPTLACERHGARCAMLDLRNPTQSIADILHAACSLLGGGATFPAYYASHRDWLGRPQVEVKGIQAFFSRVSVRAEDEETESRKWERHLTDGFVMDLGTQADPQVVLLFDALDAASESMRTWLMDRLLVQLAPLVHLRIVVSGRSVPAASGSYAALCRSYELPPVAEEEEYITYCHQIGANLVDQSIRDFARACDYKPGFFVDWAIPKFMGGQAARV